MDKQQIENIFVLGLPRSGTTALQRLIASDDRVYAPEETWILPLLQNLVSNENSLSLLNNKTATKRANFTNSDLAKIAMDKLQREAKNHGKSCFVEKTPRNYLVKYYSEIDAKKILIVRQPRDILASFITNFFDGTFKNLHGYEIDLHQGPESCVKLAERDDVYVIKYENLREQYYINDLSQYLRLEINSSRLPEFPGQIGDKDKTPYIRLKPKSKVTGAFKKFWINYHLRYNFKRYLSKFDYDLEKEKLYPRDFFTLCNFRDFAWLAVFQVRKSICLAYCRVIARRKFGFYL